jgi:hypothetical protein
VYCVVLELHGLEIWLQLDEYTVGWGGGGFLWGWELGTSSVLCLTLPVPDAFGSRPPNLRIVTVSNGLLAVLGGPIAWRRYLAIDQFRSGTLSRGEMCLLADISPTVCPLYLNPGLKGGGGDRVARGSRTRLWGGGGGQARVGTW